MPEQTTVRLSADVDSAANLFAFLEQLRNAGENLHDMYVIDSDGENFSVVEVLETTLSDGSKTSDLKLRVEK